MSNWLNSFYNGVYIGIHVSRSIGKNITYRVRTGTGSYGSKAGVIYQDKYKYTVPCSINNTQSDFCRSLYAQAVLNWQTIITLEQKKTYNKRAKFMSGYNLYIREYINSNK